jgi:hypothetical protein
MYTWVVAMMCLRIAAHLGEPWYCSAAWLSAAQIVLVPAPVTSQSGLSSSAS